MYPNSQPMAYEINDGVFQPCPPSSIAGSSSCPTCAFDGCSSLSYALERMGFRKFSKIVERSGLQNLDTNGLTVFAVCDELISDDFVENLEKLDAVNIVKSSSMNRLIPSIVFCQRIIATYGTLNRLVKLRIECAQDSIMVSVGSHKPLTHTSRVLESDLRDEQNTNVMVHSVDKLLMPDCML
jgi:hypothetical protein